MTLAFLKSLLVVFALICEVYVDARKRSRSVDTENADTEAEVAVHQGSGDMTLIYLVVGLIIGLYIVVTYIVSSSANERKILLEKSYKKNS